MPDLSLFDRERAAWSSPTVDVTGWAMRLAASALFISVGSEKFQSGSYWIRLFAGIGLGDWFRYLTGSLQIVGGLLLILPPTSRLGAAIIGSTMAGAVFVHLFVLPTGIGGAIIPAALLGFVAVIAFRRPPD